MSVPTRTVVGITTVFTPPADCSSSWTYEAQSYNSVTNGLLIQNLNQGGFATSCFPPRFSAYGRAASFVQVYSPYICPIGYATPGQFNADGTTTGICCPSGFSYGSTYSSINYFGSSSVLFMGCISTFNGVTTVPARAGNTGLTTTVVGGPLTLWGQPITVEYQQKDLLLLGVSSTSTTTSSPAVMVTNVLPPPTSSPSPTPSPTSTGLSPGATAAIVIAVALTFLLFLAAGAFFIRKRRSRGRKLAASCNSDIHKNQMMEPQVMWRREDYMVQQHRPPHELDGRPTAPIRQVNELE